MAQILHGSMPSTPEREARKEKVMEAFGSNPIQKISDRELVEAAKCGDTQAFDQLVSRYERKVLSVAQRIVNNREDAEDIAQESFHKAFRHINSFKEKSLFSTWLTRIVMNEAFMLLRWRKRNCEVSNENSEDDAKFLETTFVDQSPTPEQSCWHQERTKFLNEAINGLSPKMRRAIWLYDIEEHTVNETAQILGTSIEAVKSRIYHGHEKLRGRMNPGQTFGIFAPSPNEALCS
jgi:RNA polymerase sigma-70 factor (ECF subfamily)